MKSALEKIAATEIDGIPVYWAPPVRGLPFTAGLVFRVGCCDETLRTRGISHLLEHLVLPPRWPPVVYGGTVDNTTTSFVFSGPRRQALGLLQRTAAALGSLPASRLETERSILRTEYESWGGSRVGHAMWLRFGSAGHGLAGCEELGLEWVGKTELEAWASERFTRSTAALYLTGKPPARLVLDLPDGTRIDPPDPRPIDYLQFPSVYPYVPSGAVWLAFLAERSLAFTVAAWVLEERLRGRLRTAAGMTYETDVDRVVLNASTVHVLVSADCRDEHADAVRGLIVATLDDLAEEGPTTDELDAYVADVQRSIADASNLPRALRWHAEQSLWGSPFASEQQLLDERRRLTPGDVRDALAAARETIVLGIPEDATQPGGRFQPYPLDSPIRYTGRTFRRKGSFFRRNGDERKLVLGEKGLTLYGEGYVRSIPFDDCAAVVQWAPEVRTLWANDGMRVVVDAEIWRAGDELVAAVDRGVPAACVVVPTDAGRFDDPDLCAGYDAWQAEDYELAVDRLSRGLDRWPEESAAWEYLAASWLELGAPGEAAAAAERACELDPNSVWAHRLLADALWQLGRQPASVRAIRRAFALAPADHAALWDAAFHLADAGYEDEARRAADRLVELYPGSSGAWWVKGFADRQFARFDESAAATARAIELEPDRSSWHDDLGWALLAAGRTADSVEHFRKALGLDADNEEALENLEYALKTLGRDAEAARLRRRRRRGGKRPVEEARGELPTDRELAAGVRAARTGDWDTAVSTFRRGLERLPSDSLAWTYLAWAELERGRPLEALAAAERACSIDPGRTWAQRLRAHALWRLSRPDAAAAAIEEALSSAPDDAAILAEAAWFLADTAHEDEATRAAEAAAASAPKASLSWFAKGWTASEFGRLDEAEGALRRALALEPFDATSHSNLGWVVLKKGRPEEALERFERALELDRNHFHALRNRCLALRFLGRADEAARARQTIFEKQLEAASAELERRPGDPTALYERAEALWLLERFDEALAAARLLAGSGREVRGLRLLADLEAAVGEPANGIEAARAALQLDPDDMSSLVLLVDTTATAGNVRAARAAAADALSRNAHDPRAWYAAAVGALARGDSTDTEAWGSRVLARHPWHCCMHGVLGLARLRRGHVEAARESLEAARTAEPACLVARRLARALGR